MDTVKTNNVALLFVEHAKGYKTERALRERRAAILLAFKQGRARPTKALLEELAEINIQVGDVIPPESSHER